MRDDETTDDTATMEQIKEAVHELDPALTDESDETYRVAVLMLAASQIGTADDLALARFTNEHAEWVAQIGQRLRSSGVWTEDGGTACEWFEPESGGIAFWLDVAVAQGLVERA